MSVDVRQLLDALVAALLGWLVPYVRQLVRSRTAHGERLGGLDQRVSRIEGLLGIRAEAPELVSDSPTPRERPIAR